MKTNWQKHDLIMAELVFRTMESGRLYTDEEIHGALHRLFSNANYSRGRVRHGRLVLERQGVIEGQGKGTSERGFPCRQFIRRRLVRIVPTSHPIPQ